jgi:hypothetical protein
MPCTVNAWSFSVVVVVSTVCAEVVKAAYFYASLLNVYSTLLPGGKFIVARSAIYMYNGAWARTCSCRPDDDRTTT